MKKITLVIALLCLTIASQNIQAQEFSANTKAELAKNNFRPAIEELNTFLAANPNNEIALTYRANFLAKSGEFDKSISDANKALSINPKNLNAMIVSGSAKVGKNDLNEAIVDFSKAIAIQPNLKPALMLRAQAYFKMSDYKKALADLDYAIKDDPKNLEAYLYRSRINFDQDKFAEAASDYTFIKNNSQSGTRFYDLAAKELEVTNQKIAGNNTNNAENKRKIEQEVQAKNDEYLKKIGDDMKSVSKELNETTTRLKPLADSQAQLTAEFTTKLKALQKNDFQATTALYKEMNPRMTAMVLTYEKEIAKLKGKENLKPLEKSMTEIVESLKNLINRTRPYAARYSQYVTELNALAPVVSSDVNTLISAYNKKESTNFSTNKQAAVSSLEKIIALNTVAKKELSKFNDRKFIDVNDAEISTQIEIYTKKLNEVRGLN